MQQKFTSLTFEQKLLQRTFAEQFKNTKNAVIADLFFDNKGAVSSSHWATPSDDESALSEKPNDELLLGQIEDLLRYRANLGFPASQAARITYLDNQTTIQWVQDSLIEHDSLIDKVALIVRVLSTEREDDLDKLTKDASESAYVHCESLWEPGLSVSVLVQREHFSVQSLCDQLEQAKNRNAVFRVESYSWQKDQNGYLLCNASFSPLEISVEEFEKILSEGSA